MAQWFSQNYPWVAGVSMVVVAAAAGQLLGRGGDDDTDGTDLSRRRVADRV
jgi:hypothetical protein